MPKVSQLIEDLQRYYNPDDVIAYDIWSAEDVRNQAADDMTDDQVDRVLELMHYKKHAEYGLTWSYLGDTITTILEQDKEAS